MRSLIVNADDFGLSAGVNRGIIKAREDGIVTSASLMVRWPDAADAAEYARRHPQFSVGLHVDLGEWTYAAGAWTPLYEVVETSDAAQVAREIADQLDAFRVLTGADPTHIDSHQHVHRDEPVRALLLETARRMKVPLRDCSDVVRYCGSFYGQTNTGQPLHDAIAPATLIEVLRSLPDGTTELGCHPGYDAVRSVYHREREQEIRTLCDARVSTVIADEGIRLCSFRDLATR